MRVTGLFIYPCKSARAVALDTSPIDALGLSGDRRAMITDPSGRFITQRELPELARIRAVPGETGLQLTMDGQEGILAASPHPDRRMDVVVWRSIVSAAAATDNVNDRLSDWLGRPVKLALFDRHARRAANPEWAGPDSPVTFADGYPVLVTTTGSLKALNGDMTAHGEFAVAMDRFRPNIVVDADEPFAEDRWAAIEIAGVRLDLVKPCARCIMTTQDQETGSRGGANPVPALGRIRMSADRRVPGILFGWNAVPRGEGTLTIGDAVRITADRPEGWAIKAR